VAGLARQHAHVLGQREPAAPAYSDEPDCQSYARVAIVDSERATARGCPRHAVAALDGISRAHVDWADSKGLSEWERKALELAEERSRLPALW
jgi:hypothetical protein